MLPSLELRCRKEYYYQSLMRKGQSRLSMAQPSSILIRCMALSPYILRRSMMCIFEDKGEDTNVDVDMARDKGKGECVAWRGLDFHRIF